MNYSIKFYPEKRNGSTTNVPVMLSVTYSKLRMFYYTGLRCNKDQWYAGEEIDGTIKRDKNEHGKLKRNQIAPDGKTSTDFNKELTRITAAVDDLFTIYAASPNVPPVDQLRNDLKKKLGKKMKTQDREDFFGRFEQYIRTADLSDNRKITLNSILTKLKTFNPETTYTNLDPAEFQKYLSDNGISNNSRALLLNGLKTFIKHSIDKDYTVINPFKTFKFDSEKYSKPIYLTIEERDHLFNAVIEDKQLAVVRDIFVLQCMIGCRYGDLMRLTHTNIVDGSFEYIAAKTKKDESRKAIIPLTEKAKIIIARYNEPAGRLLPFMKLHDCNYFIKKLFKSVGLTRTVTIKDKTTLLETQVTLDTIASTHMSRRTFIGGLFKNKVTDAIIVSMSGHVKGSKAIGRYYAVDPEQQREAMKLIE